MNNYSNKNIKKDLPRLFKAYKQHFNKPLVIEISGTPNSGKSSVIKSIEKMMIRNNICHSVIQELALKCKIPDKLSEDFNIWTACETICSLVHSLNHDKDVIILERGIFDALCWCEFHYRRNKLNSEEKNIFNRILTMDRFTKPISILYIFSCSSETAISREYSVFLHSTEGRIINKNTVDQINDSISFVKQKYASIFARVDELDSTGYTPKDLEEIFADRLYTTLHEIIDI